MAIIEGQVILTPVELEVILTQPAEGHVVVVAADGSIVAIPGSEDDHVWLPDDTSAPIFPVQLGTARMIHDCFEQHGRDIGRTVGDFAARMSATPDIDKLEAALVALRPEEDLPERRE